MKSQMIKIDYNNLLNVIDDVMSKSRSKIVKENSFGIGVGLELLSRYIIKIAERAIELNDDVLLELLQNMMVIKKVEHPTEESGEGK